MTFNTLESKTLVQVVMLGVPVGTVEMVQLPEDIGAAAFVGPETVAVNTIRLPNAGAEAFAVTIGMTVIEFTCVAWAKAVTAVADE